MSIPELTIDRLLELAHGQAINLIMGNKEQIMPVFLILTGDDQVIIAGVPWSDEDEKQAAIKLLRLLMAENKATSYSFLTEAWISAQAANDPDRTPPSQRANRQEVIQAMATDGTNTKYKTWLIVRDNDGNCADLLPMKEAGIYMSRFEGLLPNSPKPN